MGKNQITACPLCASNQIKSHFRCTDYDASGETFDIFECSSCHFRFTQGAPDSSEIGRYYEVPSYISHTDTKQGLMNRLYHRVRSYMLRRKATLVEQSTQKKSGRLLEIGAGTGYFAHTMTQRGWQVEGIEKSAQARAFAATHFNLTLLPENEGLQGLEAKSYDAICLWHVLEHLEGLHERMDRFKELLSPDGRLVIALPNCASFDARHYQEEWAAYDVPRHLWHFTPATLRQLAEAHGFELVKMYPMPFDAFYLAMLSEKRQQHAAALLRGGWVGLCAWFASLGRRKESSSIIYILKQR